MSPPSPSSPPPVPDGLDFIDGVTGKISTKPEFPLVLLIMG